MSRRIILAALFFLVTYTNEVHSADLTIKISTKNMHEQSFVNITSMNYILHHPTTYNSSYIIYDIEVEFLNNHPTKTAIAQARYTLGDLPASAIAWWGWPFKTNGYSERIEFLATSSPEMMKFRFYLRYNDFISHQDTLLFDVDVWFKNEEQTTLVNRKIKYIFNTEVPYENWVPSLQIPDAPIVQVPIKQHGYKYLNSISIDKREQETIWYFDTLNGMPTAFRAFSNEELLKNNYTYGFMLKRTILEGGYDINFYSDIGYIYWDNVKPEVSPCWYIETESTVPFAKIVWCGGRDNTYIKQYFVYRYVDMNEPAYNLPIDTIITSSTDTLDNVPRYIEDTALLQDHVYIYRVEAEDAAGNIGSLSTGEPVFLTPEPDVEKWYTQSYSDTEPSIYFTNSLKATITVPEATLNNGLYHLNYQTSKFLNDFQPGAEPSTFFSQSDWISATSYSFDHPSEGKWFYRVQLKHADYNFYSRYCDVYSSLVDATSPSIIPKDSLNVAVLRSGIDADSLIVNISWQEVADKSGILDYHIYRKDNKHSGFKKLYPSSVPISNNFYDYFGKEVLNDTLFYEIIPEDSAGNRLDLSPSLAKTVSPRYGPIIDWANENHDLIFFDTTAFDTRFISGYVLQTTVYGNRNNVVFKAVNEAKILGDFLVKTNPPMSGRMGLRLGVTYALQQCEGITYYSNELYVNSTAAADQEADIATNLTVQQNFPNPFNSVTTINYSLPFTANLECNIINIQGRIIKSHKLDNCPPGQGSIVWDATDAKGYAVSSGIYFLMIHCRPLYGEQLTILKKLTYIK